MARRFRLSAVVIAAWLVAAPAFGQATTQSQDVSDTDSWIRAESDHFVVYGDWTQADTIKRVKALEQFHYFLNIVLPPDDPDAPEPKLTIYLVRDHTLLQWVDPRNAAGLYSACKEGVVAFSSQADFDPSKWVHASKDVPAQDESQVILFHEYTHHVMFRHTAATYPLWYIEGYADYFSTFAYDGQWAWIGLPPNTSSNTLDQVNWGGFDRVLKPDAQLSSGLATVDGADPLIFYAKAWLLTHYMMNDPERAKMLDAYMARLDKGEDPVAAFTAATGIDVDGELPRRLHAYSKAMPYRKIELPAMPDAAVSVTPLDATADSYQLLYGALKTCPPNAVGTLELKYLRAAGNADAIADLAPPKESKSWDKLVADMRARAPAVAKSREYQFALAYGEILFGNPHAPLTWLATIAKDDADYPRAQYLVGRAWLAAAGGQTGADRSISLKTASQALAIAYTANPDDAATNYFLALSLDTGDEPPSDNAVNAAVGAVDAAPSVYDYAELAAIFELRRNDRDDAIALLKPFSNDPHAPKRAERVRGALAAISQGADIEKVRAALKNDDDTSAAK